MIATAIIAAIAFGTVYLVVQKTVLKNLDDDLSFEAKKHTHEITILADSIRFKNMAEWKEREHTEVQVNPVFIQLMDKEGQIMDKSPNLKLNTLPFNESEFGGYFNYEISGRSIRQVQLPIEQEGKIKGYILAAMSSEAAFNILLKLRNVLLVSYLIILVGLYFVSRFLAGRSIKPIQDVTNTITRITKNNLTERVTLPQNKDEIYELSTAFNALLTRIENALERERQFTSDASHELRTPLATLRGTLEVLIRKPRTAEEYVEKIGYSLTEIEKMTLMLEQLLLLARLDSKSVNHDLHLISLPTILDESLSHHKKLITDKDLHISLDFDHHDQLMVPHYYTNLMIGNILSNAIKYAKVGSSVYIKIDVVNNRVRCSIKDEGIGIAKEDLSHIYESFFRSNSLDHKHIAGNGLGLSIVKKCADAIQASISIDSVLGEGTTVSIQF
jgi:signal transduction histidine kinase